MRKNFIVYQNVLLIVILGFSPCKVFSGLEKDRGTQYNEAMGSAEYWGSIHSYPLLQKLAREANLDVEENVRFKDNFQRVWEQVKKLHEKRATQAKFTSECSKLFEEISCFYHKWIMGSPGVQSNPIAKKPLEEAWIPVAQNYGAVKALGQISDLLGPATEKYRIPAKSATVEREQKLGELRGWMAPLRMKATFNFLGRLKAEGLLKVDPEFSIVSNLLRVEDQVIEEKTQLAKQYESNKKAWTATEEVYSCFGRVFQQVTPKLLPNENEKRELKGCYDAYQNAFLQARKSLDGLKLPSKL